MSKKLEGQVAVVTGASKGIGAAIAEHLAAAGAAVVVNYASSKAGAEAVVQRIRQNGGKAVAVQADVSKLEDVRRLFAETKKAFGKLDILVNNAGIYEFLPLEAITAEHAHKQFDINVLGLLFATQEAVKHFGPSGGSIVNISSVAATAAPPTAVRVQRHQGGRESRSRDPWPRSWGRVRSASTWSAPEWSKPRVGTPPALPTAISKATEAQIAARQDRPAERHRAGGGLSGVRRFPWITGEALHHRRIPNTLLFASNRRRSHDIGRPRTGYGREHGLRIRKSAR